MRISPQRFIWLLCTVAVFCLTACKERELHLRGDEETELPLRFAPHYPLSRADVRSTKAGEVPTTRSLVESQADFERACTPGELTYQGQPGGDNAIGFWVDYYGPVAGVPDLWNKESDIFAGTTLVYRPRPGTPWLWNYEGEAQRWRMGGRYIVRAYYPQALNEYIVAASTSANLFALEYNTHLLQEDLMVAYNKVHTVDPVSGGPSIALAYDELTGNFISSQVTEEEHPADPANPHRGFDQSFDLSDPIPLDFRHTLAAVRMQFAFDFDDQDELLGLRFYNTGEAEGFHTVGLLLYGDDSSPEITKGLASQDLQDANLDKNNIRWITYQSVSGSSFFYRWEIAQPAAGAPNPDPSLPRGIPFGRTTTRKNGVNVTTEHLAVAYTQYPMQLQRLWHNGVLQPGSTYVQDETAPLPMAKNYPPYFNENHGWILLLPQRVPTNVVCRFTTRKMGTVEVAMPSVTGTLQDGTPDPNGRYFAPGCRYVFTITLTKVDARASVHIAPWTERYANVDIDF